MRCGIFVKILNGRLAMFVPFANASYTNTWSHKLQIDPRFKDIHEYFQAYGKCFQPIEYIRDAAKWWANGSMICNVEPHDIWGGHGLVPLRDLFVKLCRQRCIQDCEFFVNKRDSPMLKKDVTEPFDAIFNDHSCPLSRQVHAHYAPILSFYTNPRFADIPFPSADDWMVATGKVYPRENDLFSSFNYTQHYVPWSQRIATAFFRGNATGSGVKPETNQRIRLAQLSHDWGEIPKYNAMNPIDQTMFLDAGLTSWNPRSKIRFGERMCFIEPTNLSIGLVEPVPMSVQCRYKYQVYVAGHCAASRFSYLAKSAALILFVESNDDDDSQLWYAPLLQPMHHFIPVKADLSDLAQRIEWCKTHDDQCEAIASNVKNFYDQYLCENAILDYAELTVNSIAASFVAPAKKPSFGKFVPHTPYLSSSAQTFPH